MIERQAAGHRAVASPRTRLAIAALIAVAGVAALLAWQAPRLYRALPFVSPDSSGYLAWDAMRPAVYPLLLRAVRDVSPDLTLLGPLQLIALLASAVWLGISLASAIGRAWLAIALGALVMLHPQLVSYAFTVLPESLFASLVMLHASSVMWLLANRRMTSAVAAGLMLAAAILAKPAGLALLPGLVVLATTCGRDGRGWRLVGGMLAAIVLPLLIASGANYLRIGVFSPQAIGGYALLGVTGTFMPDDTPIEPASLGEALMTKLRPIRDELAGLDSIETRYFYSAIAYHPAVDESSAIILAHLRAADPSASEQELFLRLNAIGQAIAWETITRAPRAYARHVTSHLYGLWLMPLIQNASDRDQFEASLARAAQQTPRLAREPVMYRMVPWFVYWPFKGFLILTLVGSLVSIAGWVVRRASIEWTLAAYAAVMLHAYFLLTAMTQTGLPRYAVSVWPLTVLTLVSFVAALLSIATSRSARQSAR